MNHVRPQSFSVIRCASADGIRHIQLSDAERNNPLGPQMVMELRTAIEKSTAAETLLFSADGRNFCAGGDHDELAKLSTDEFRAYVTGLKSLFGEILMASPSVVCVQRAAVGGGAELALRADLIVAGDDAFFQFPQLSVGARVGAETLALLISRVGLGKARRWCLTGERIDAPSALKAGLIDDMVDRSELLSVGMDLTKKLTELSGAGVSRFKSTVNSLITPGALQASL